MRIVSGEYKYRKIEIPKEIRPTTEKVREAVFSILSFKVEESVVLDLFAGSGSLGLEALSRGVAKCYFNENKKNILEILKQNIHSCRAEEKSIVMNSDFRQSIGMINDKLDIVFIDPPYKDGYNNGWYEKSMKLIEDKGLAKDGTIVVAEHLDKYSLDEEYGSFKMIKNKKYGSIGINIYIYEEKR